jgi:hypothetical protein
MVVHLGVEPAAETDTLLFFVICGTHFGHKWL